MFFLPSSGVTSWNFRDAGRWHETFGSETNDLITWNRPSTTNISMFVIPSPKVSSLVQFSRSVVYDSAIPWITAHQASLAITNSQSSLRLTSIESVMPSSHLILCHPLPFLPPIPPSIRVFSNESTLCMRWPKYWSFSFSIIPSKELMLLNCGVGEDSWESLGLQGDPASPFWRSALGFLWKEWC